MTKRKEGREKGRFRKGKGRENEELSIGKRERSENRGGEGKGNR